MATKGQKLKNEITSKILACFGDSAFLYNDGKEIRINGEEDGVEVQIKVTLTAAKVPVTKDEEYAIPGEAQNQSVEASLMVQNFDPFEKSPIEPTKEEKENIAMLLSKLGL